MAGTAASKPVQIGFTGAQQDDATGLLDLHARLYDPGIGRFTSPDPLRGVGGQAANPYSYVLNNPETLRDPTGLQEDSGDPWANVPFLSISTEFNPDVCAGECEFSEGETFDVPCSGICGGGNPGNGTAVADDSSRRVTGNHEAGGEQNASNSNLSPPLPIQAQGQIVQFDPVENKGSRSDVSNQSTSQTPCQPWRVQRPLCQRAG